MPHVGSGLRTLSVYARSHPVAFSANHATAAGSSVLRKTRLSSCTPASPWSPQARDDQLMFMVQQLQE